MKRTGIERIVFASLVAALCFLAVQPTTARAQSSDGSGNRGYDYTGVYLQAGAAVGEVHARGDSQDASGGFTLGGGYRMLPWLAADANFTFLGNSDDEYFAFTAGPKFYPLGAFNLDAIPDSFQPYALVGIGGAQFNTDGRQSLDDKGTFIFRMILGADFWLTDHIGVFVEGGGHAATKNKVDGIGIFTLGAQYRF